MRLTCEKMLDKYYPMEVTTWTLAWSPIRQLQLRLERPIPLWKTTVLRRELRKYDCFIRSDISRPASG